MPFNRFYEEITVHEFHKDIIKVK